MFMKGADNMKKLTASILSLILCTSPVIASADTSGLSKEEIINKLQEQFGSNIITNCKDISLEELLNKFGGCLNNKLPLPDTDNNIQLPPENNTPSIPEEDTNTPVIPEDDNSSESTPEVNKSFELQVLDLVNEERTARGLSPLTYSEELAKVAASHSADMANRNYFSHNSPEGVTPFNRIKNAGISYKSAGENIAAGQDTPEAVVDAWMNSDGHRANILNKNFTKMGVGCVYGGSYGIYWTQLFTG